MSYLQQPATSNRKLVALGIAVIVHVALGYAMITGLAVEFVKKIVEPIETVNVEEEPPPDEPPPPPPELQDVPVVTPPPIVTVETPPPPTAIVTETTIVRPIAPSAPIAPPAPPVISAPAPAPPAPVVAAVRAKLRNARSTAITTDDYPDASIRAEEEGTTIANYEINEQGRVENCVITQSSGHPRLDETVCRLLLRRFRYDPAKAEGGTPVRSKDVQRVRWQLPEN